MFARASLVALVLAVAPPAWADADYPAGLFERSPLNGPPADVSHPKMSLDIDPIYYNMSYF